MQKKCYFGQKKIPLKKCPFFEYKSESLNHQDSISTGTSAGVSGPTCGNQGSGNRQHARGPEVATADRESPGRGGKSRQAGAHEGPRFQAASSAEGLQRFLRAARPEQ